MKVLGVFLLVGGVLLAAGVAWWLGLGSGDTTQASPNRPGCSFQN